MAKETYVDGQLYRMPIADLYEDADQPRKYHDPEFRGEMTESARQHGIIVPIVVRRDGDGRLTVVAGHVRYNAAKLAGLTTIPAIFVVTDNPREIALIENYHRSNLTPVEEAEAFGSLMAAKPCNQQELGRIFCKSKAIISEILSLTRLPQAIRDACRMDPTVPKRVLIDIARLEDEGQMQAAFEKYKAKVNPVKPSETVRPTPA
jgi:ParB family chromosome partitioning protein